jgi:predicted NAD/FAD-dependent oxidoreductase
MTAIAKALSQGLEICRGQRAITLQPDAGLWQIGLEAIAPSAASTPALTASAVALTIPTLQAVELLHPLVAEGMPASLLTSLQSVDYAPCITAIAAYDAHYYPVAAQLPWTSVAVAPPSDLLWVSLEHTKRLESKIPAVIVQSSAAFAEAYLDAADLKAVGQHLLHQAAQQLGPEGTPITWLEDAQELQTHRWRYALVRSPLKTAPLASALPLPLACSGDWSWGQGIEAALQAGLDLAETVDQQLRHVGVPAATTVLG